MNMKQQLTKILSWVVLLLPALVCGFDSAFDRVLGISYANTGGPQLGLNDTYFFQQIDRVNPPITAMVVFLLNVANPEHYNSTLHGLKKRGIIIVPGIGDYTKYNINSTHYKQIARATKPYTDYIQLENMQEYSEENNGVARIEDMIEFLNGTLGYQHVQLNAWPRIKGQQAVVPFDNPAVDSSIEQVLLDFSRTNFTVYPNTTNWWPNQKKIDEIRKFRPTASILINYENAPQEEALAKLSKNQQVAAMKTTIRKINQYNEDLSWTAPFTQNYNPIKIGTWPFIIKELSSM